MSRRKASSVSETPYVSHSRSLLQSPAWRVLSLRERKVLDRIELEHMHHGGNDNGKLPVTYTEFARYGIDRKVIRSSINVLVALGLVIITRPGRRSGGDDRWPNLFCLTYVATKVGMSYVPASNDFRRIETDAQAKAIARTARKPEKSRRAIDLAVMRARKRVPAIVETGDAQPCQLRQVVHDAAPPVQITASSSSSGVLRGAAQ